MILGKPRVSESSSGISRPEASAPSLASAVTSEARGEDAGPGIVVQGTRSYTLQVWILKSAPFPCFDQAFWTASVLIFPAIEVSFWSAAFSSSRVSSNSSAHCVWPSS